MGRELEQDRISVLLLSSARLITVVGPGGIGKTRLAAETLRRFRKATDTPVFWARLARLPKDSDVAAVEEEVAHSVVEADFSGRSAWDSFVGTLTRTDGTGRSLQTVLVMDNCEHVLLGAGRVIAELLDAVPGLTILATSREAVGWSDEHLVHATPLAPPQALTLFRQRAELTGRPVADGEQAVLAEAICRHVHGNPLYVRLAAARLLRQPLAGVLAELSGEPTDKRMGWSHGPRVGAEERHQGVRDVIAWSYDLCSDKEQVLLERMSVFAAGYDTLSEDDSVSARDVGADLEAIEAVCADDDRGDTPGVRLAGHEVERLLERLADQSMVTVHITPTAVRYSLLESIRLFARHKLAERSTGEVDEPARLADRHRRYYRDKVVRAQCEWFGPADRDLLIWARAAWDNIVTAIESSLTVGDPTLGLQITVGLASLEVFRGSLREIRWRTERTLQATRTLSPQPVELQTAAMAAIVWLALWQGLQKDAERMLEDCVDTCLGDREVGQNWRQTPESDIGLPPPVEFAWGAELFIIRRDPRAVTVLARAKRKYGALGDRTGEAKSRFYEVWTASFIGSPQQATEVARRYLDDATASGIEWAKSWAEVVWATALTRHGDPAEAVTVGRRILASPAAARTRSLGAVGVHLRIWSLARIITNSIEGGNADKAELRVLATELAHLAGGARREWEELGVSFDGLRLFADETTMASDVARRVLGREAYAAAEKRGALLCPKLREVQRLALGTLPADRLAAGHSGKPDQSTVKRTVPSLWGELSGAERQVAILAAAGWANSAIAARRGSSARTVDAQMAAILQKLMLSSREEIIGLVPKNHIDQIRAEAARQPRRPGERPRKPRPS